MDDAILYLLQRAYSALDKPNTMVRITFFDFSSAFNTIQPRLLSEKLERMDVDAPLIARIYLTIYRLSDGQTTVCEVTELCV